MENFGIAGLTYAGSTPPEPPILLVIGHEKSGKSGSAITLHDWPKPGGRPLVLAFDASGVDTCFQLGYPIACIKVKDQPGISYWDKTSAALRTLKSGFANRRVDFPFTSIVVDCASTMTEKFHEEATGRGGDPRQAYGAVLEQSKHVMWSLLSLGVPTIWLSWLSEPFVEEKGSGNNKSRKQVMGRALTTGNFKKLISGKATQILYLDKINVGVGQPGADAFGCARVFHTQPYGMVDCGGRYSNKLPEPCPAHLGYVLNCIMGTNGVNK